MKTKPLAWNIPCKGLILVGSKAFGGKISYYVVKISVFSIVALAFPTRID
jgi:hypothetical protein